MRSNRLLIDLAKNAVSPVNYSELARRLDVTRQTIFIWKSGDSPLPRDRIAQLAKMAGEDVGEWVLRIETEASTGDARKGLEQVMKRLGMAAAVAALCVLPYPAFAQGIQGLSANEFPSMYIMSIRRWLRRLAAKVRSPAGAWRLPYAA